jgi:hypothetical protein
VIFSSLLDFASGMSMMTGWQDALYKWQALLLAKAHMY